MAGRNNDNVENRKLEETKKVKENASSTDIEKVAKEAEENRTRKPGSQSNHSKQHNNGRGGGK